MNNIIQLNQYFNNQFKKMLESLENLQQDADYSHLMREIIDQYTNNQTELDSFRYSKLAAAERDLLIILIIIAECEKFRANPLLSAYNDLLSNIDYISARASQEIRLALRDIICSISESYKYLELHQAT